MLKKRTKTEKFKNYLILGLFTTLAIVLLLKQCSSPTKPKEVYIKGKEVVIHDTIPAPYKVVEFKTKYYPQVSIIEKVDTLLDASLCQYRRTYNDSLSNDSITIYTKISTIGLLESSKVSYRWKLPTIKTTISRTDTLIRPSKFQFFVNSEIGENQDKLNIYPGATLVYKKVELGYSYGLIDKTHNIRIGFRLFKSRK